MKKLLGLLAIVFLSSIVFAGEADVAITIYNNNLGLVKDVRSLDLQKGISFLDFNDVAAEIDPTSVNFRCLSNPDVAVLEQNYLYDLVSTEALLKRYLGLAISVVSEDDCQYRGKLLSSDGRNIILEDESGPVMVVALDKVINYNFPTLPEGLILKPTLRWQIDSPSTGAKNCEVSYLTSGISWQADYVAVVSDDDSRLDISGWVTITNNTGTAYNDAKLKLVAGDVHKVTSAMEEADMLYASPMAKGAREPQFEEESFFEYHLYTLTRPATLNDKEIKQLSLFPTTQTKANKVFIFDSQTSYYSRSNDNSIKIKVNMEFENSAEAGLGMPLPKGKLRVYKEDSQKALQFVGEDLIDHTPKDEKVRVYLGDAFDIVGQRKQINVEDLGKNRSRETYEITLKNHKQEDITVTVVEHPYGWREWQIISSSLEYRKVDNYKIEFDLKVAKDSEKTITYVIQYN